MSDDNHPDPTRNTYQVPLLPGRWFELTWGEALTSTARIGEALQQDKVVKVVGLQSGRHADQLMHQIAQHFSLEDSLELQAGYATSKGHRRNVGEYFMTVYDRDDYRVISPHSEGSSYAGMQMAAFYCERNDTDGGETVLLQVDQDSPQWASLRERKTKALCTRALTPADAAKLKRMFQVDSAYPVTAQDDIVSEHKVTPELTLVHVLTPLCPIYSRLAEKEVFTYWDTVESVDAHSPQAFAETLANLGLLKLPEPGTSLAAFDDAYKRRLTTVAVRYQDLFQGMLVHKLQPGEMILFNNMTWAHAVNNWTPGSGERTVSAAFA
ncbi:hypothetical protein OPW41_12045 [Vibrio europaeus]|uniref:hypothetical protein n=1 Tax=Vibrio europaeus TaxID=300876 RepID=UPI00148C31F0|nr:hypothetical protein [Vibrio europaeus]MDC5721915.1 hypothetical protein [Vibrio europaeus]MDC5758303.1 hypothetical protein [Vibrio europaeus]MDC5776579.1 hypothetical protein [Vibrio europaeus]MDC5795562.1 hypothetical protein [Vibrio europaeus]MDC5801505.1 hypothetical protein [Vibrio europaeus]